MAPGDVPDSRPLPLPEIAAALPDLPGVYRFFDRAGTLLYVGKAKSLRRRVRTYFGGRARLGPRIAKMVSEVARLETTITPTEDDALLLESDQIKARQPRYNILFRDDATYPYLKISGHRYARLLFFRGNPGAGCFGPFPNSRAVKESIRLLQRVFRLRTCSDAMLANRSRPCLLHQIGRCSAPCVGLIDEREYAQDAAAALAFMRGDSSAVTADLAAQMEQASAGRDYERAARLRDSINALAEVRHRSAVSGGAEDADFIGAHCAGGAGAVRLAAVRGGRMVGEIDFFATAAGDAAPADLISAFVGQHYGRHRMPARVVVMNCGLAAAALADQVETAGGRFIVAPRRAELERVRLCCTNAAAALAERGGGGRSLQLLADRIGGGPVGRFDCFDVSHSMGEKAVASCVVCIDGRMEKRLYRRMRLADSSGGDDCAGIREAVFRRYRRASSEPGALPDLVVVDGGAGQVGAAVEALAAAGAGGCRVLGIAKGAGRRPGCETLMTGDGQVVDLPPTDRGFHLLQNARDEAHRFALAYHRKRRDRSRRGSLLDDVEGVGPKLRRAILNEFGGLQGLRRAGTSDLTRIKGVGAELARRIYLALHR